MKAAHTTNIVGGKKTADKKTNPFSKLIEDEERIAKAVVDKVSLSTLKDIKFVRPI